MESILSAIGASPPQNRCALVVGHPGHELKVFGWMARYKPRVYVITDGSGWHGNPRTPSSAALIRQLGCEPGDIFGCMSDVEIYEAILKANIGLFLRLVDQIADSFLKHEIEIVCGDAAEGYNPTHDLCRLLLNAAVFKAEHATGRSITNLEFCLTEWDLSQPQQHDSRCLHGMLDDHLLAAKLAAAEGYTEMRNEVRYALSRRGREYFRLECFRDADGLALPLSSSSRPLYELTGEQRIGEGKYRTVIRLQEHILPIMSAVLDHAVGAMTPVTSENPYHKRATGTLSGN